MQNLPSRMQYLMLLLCLVLLPGRMQGETVDPPTGDNICLMSTLDLTKITCFDDNGATKVRADKSTVNNDIVMKGDTYTSGVGTHAPSKAVIEVKGATRFKAALGIDDEAQNQADHGIVDYEITLFRDNSRTGTVLKSGTVTRQDEQVVDLDFDIAGADYLVIDLKTGAKPWADHVDLGNAYFEYTGEKPQTIDANDMWLDETNVVKLPTEGADGAIIVPLSSLEIQNSTSGWRTNQANKSIEGNPIIIGGTRYESGIGTHATGVIVVKLNGSVTRFVASAGIDDEVKDKAVKGNVNWTVDLRAENGDVLRAAEGNAVAGDAAKPVDVDCNGWKYLILTADANGANENDHFDWANAYFEYYEQNSTMPEIVPATELESKVACATTMFSQPGVRYMHKIRATSAEATLNVTDLPAGLTWNAARRLVEGSIETEGTYTYTIEITNGEEVTREPVSLTVSSSLPHPVPFMGWISWNVVEGEISENVIKTVSDAFITSGLYDAGYNYLVIDDLWHASAREAGTNKPLPDARKFPNGMKAAIDYAHSKGLKFGIYSDAATRTCAGAYGSLGYEEIDAKQYAEWGVDLLKYDYCGAPSDVLSAQRLYKTMGDALKASGRNILFYMCEWGAREPWKWGAETGATTWRCTYDTRDCWIGKNGGIGVIQSIAGMKDIWAYSGVNRYNDADMMCVGIHGTGKSSNALCQTGPGMTMTEYKTQFALWCMWASPLSLSFDLRKAISAEDLELMTNKELIAVNQDRMGLQAELISEADNTLVLMKDLENGDVAISVTNLGESTKNMTLDFSAFPALNTAKKYNIRDLMQQAEVATEVQNSFDVSVPAHGTCIYRFVDSELVGISHTGIEASKAEVSCKDGNVVVKCPATGGAAKRVLVSDLAGHVVASATSAAETVSLPMAGAPKGCYVVSVTCGGKAQAEKVIF